MKRLSSTPEDRAEALARCPLFEGLGAGDLRTLAGVALLREYEDGESLFRREQAAEGFCVVASGQVKVCRFSADGREQLLHLFGDGEPVGEVPVFQGGRYPATAMAVGRLRALYLPRDRFLALGREQPELLLNMLAVLSTRLRHFVSLVDDLSLKEVSARLAKHLLDLSARADGAQTVELDTTKAMLASRLGTIAATLSRTLAKVQDRGIIRVDGRRIALLDRERLQELAAGMKLEGL
jgi:CRP/FNR family transcriptional regulator